jgi:hypothetical protein
LDTLYEKFLENMEKKMGQYKKTRWQKILEKKGKISWV